MNHILLYIGAGLLFLFAGGIFDALARHSWTAAADRRWKALSRAAFTLGVLVLAAGFLGALFGAVEWPH